MTNDVERIVELAIDRDMSLNGMVRMATHHHAAGRLTEWRAWRRAAIVLFPSVNVPTGYGV